VVVTATGADCAEALGAVAAGVDLPAARLHGEQVLWLVDGDAAAAIV
jgi:hypothetical protein